MEYCGPRGLPHSHFLGGPDRWTEDDRAKALWWQVHDRSTCRACGTRTEEWLESAGGSRDAYAAEPYSCRGCELLAAEQEAIDKAPPGTYPRATRARLTDLPSAEE